MAEHREAGVGSSSKGFHPDDEPLPEWEELTPEILQDECLRGDFVIRWAVVLLAVLLGWMYITETSVLLAVKTGEATLRRGGIPLRVDPFSASAEGRSWTNLHWLSDLVLAAWHMALGLPGLTLLCALVAGLTYFLLTGISAKNESTWWSSSCAALSLAAAVPMLQPGETSLSLLGMALLLRGLHLWVQAPGGKLRWQLPLLMVLWSNMDSRAWLGMVILLAFAVGSLVTRLPQLKQARKQTWIMTAIALVAGLLISPWPGAQATSVWSQIQASRAAGEYVSLSEFFPALSLPFVLPGQVQTDQIFVYFCWALMGLALFTMILNVMRLELRWLLMWLAATGLSLISGETACIGALVNGVVAAVNGQAWYRRNFSMEYRIDAWNVFTGRAGRAITVLGLFFVAYLAINGALLGPQGRRVGLGLDPRWTNRIESLRTEVVPRTAGDRVFPVVPTQGDLLIWLGQKPFIDSRIALYQRGSEDLVKLHVETRTSIFPPLRPEQDRIDPQAWRKTLDQYKIANVQVRLWGDTPAYRPLIQMFQHPEWTMTALGAAAANFTRNNTGDAALTEHIAKYRADDFPKEAFRPATPLVVSKLTPVWSYPPSTYNEWIIQKLRVIPSSAQRAMHYEEVVRQLSTGLNSFQLAALATMIVRDSRAGLEINPNDQLSWLMLERGAALLQQAESTAAAAAGNPQLPNWRRYQRRAAIFNAARANPRSLRTQLSLVRYLFEQQEVDLALRELDVFEAKFGTLSAADQQLVDLTDAYRVRPQLQKYVADTQQEVTRAQTGGADLMMLVQQCLAARCPGLAFQLMQADLTKIQSPEAQLIYASLQMTNGDIEGAFVTVQEMRQTMERTDLPPEAAPLVAQWKNLAAEILQSTGDLPETIKLWRPDEWTAVRKHMLNGLLVQPFGSWQLQQEQDMWPATTGRIALMSLADTPDAWGQAELRIGMAEITEGKLKEARARLENIIEKHPSFNFRGVAGFYLAAMTSEPVSVAPPPPLFDLPIVYPKGEPPRVAPSPAKPQPLP